MWPEWMGQEYRILMGELLGKRPRGRPKKYEIIDQRWILGRRRLELQMDRIVLGSCDATDNCGLKSTLKWALLPSVIWVGNFLTCWNLCTDMGILKNLLACRECDKYHAGIDVCHNSTNLFFTIILQNLDCKLLK